jgi:hypothetical protein
MFLDEALAMVRNCPTEGAIADMLAAEGVVAIPTEASQCALAAFFKRCDNVYSAEVYGNDESVGEVLIHMKDDDSPYIYKLTIETYQFMTSFDTCKYPKLVAQDIVDVYDMYRGYSLKFYARTNNDLVLRVFEKDSVMRVRESHYVDLKDDGSVDFTKWDD